VAPPQLGLGPLVTVVELFTLIYPPFTTMFKALAHTSLEGAWAVEVFTTHTNAKANSQKADFMV
jgi:hypothetical protein